MTHDAEHDRILRAVAERSLAVDDPTVSALARRCERCRAELAELREIELALQRSARLREEVLSLAHAEQAPSTAAVFESSLRSAIAGTADPVRAPRRGAHAEEATGARTELMPHKSGRRRVMIFALAAAAIALGLGLIVWRNADRQAQTTSGVLLGGRTIDVESTPTARREDLTFAWSAKLSPGSGSTLLVEGRDPTTRVWTPLRALETGDQRWKPTADEARAWPQELRWRVVARSASGALEAESAWTYVTLLD
jgi:hypothetical protein